MFNTQMQRDPLMLWDFNGVKISNGISEYKNTIADEPAKERCCFIANMEQDWLKIQSRKLFLILPSL